MASYKSMTFEDRLGLLVDAEWNARKSNRRTYYCAVYPDDSFTALEKSFFWNETETSCLWQAVTGEKSPLCPAGRALRPVWQSR